MGIAPHVQELRALLGPQALLLPWAKGTKGGRRKWAHTTIERMEDPRYLAQLAEGNIGVALGDKSAGLCSLDIDCDVELSEFLELNSAIGNTLRSRGRRGGNLWWQVAPPYPPLTLLKRRGKAWGEWRSTGGQTIIYGTHPTGPEYRIVNRVKPLAIKLIEIKWPEGVFPLLQGGSLVSDTERTEPTELPERTEPTEWTERTEANRSGVHTMGVSPLINTETEAIEVALPKETHQSHKSLFVLARAIKALSLSQGRTIPITEMKSTFLKWHTRAMPFLDPSQSQDDYWFEFLEAHERAAHPLGVDVLTSAWESAHSKPPPAVAMQFASPEIQRLVSFCRELQMMSKTSPFFLSTRSVQKLFALPTPMSASRWLKGLCRSQILKVEEQGKLNSGRASRFRYLPPL